MQIIIRSAANTPRPIKMPLVASGLDGALLLLVLVGMNTGTYEVPPREPEEPPFVPPPEEPPLDPPLEPLPADGICYERIKWLKPGCCVGYL